MRRVFLVVLLALLSGACGDSSESGDNDVAATITRAGSATRNSAPLSFVQTLRTETEDGSFLEQRTEGVYSGDQASLLITTEGDAQGVFTAGSIVEPGSIVEIVIADEIYLRVSFLGVDDDAPWTLLPSPSPPVPDSTVSILGSGLVATTAEAEVIGEPGDRTIAGMATTRYRAPAPAADVAIYLPTETLELLVEQGLVRDTISSTATIDYWVADDGRLLRVEIDHTELIQELDSNRGSTGSPATSLVHTFEVVQFGDVSVEVPAPEELVDSDS